MIPDWLAAVGALANIVVGTRWLWLEWKHGVFKK